MISGHSPPAPFASSSSWPPSSPASTIDTCKPQNVTPSHPGAPDPKFTRQPATIAGSVSVPNWPISRSCQQLGKSPSQLPEIFDSFHPARDQPASSLQHGGTTNSQNTASFVPGPVVASRTSTRTHYTLRPTGAYIHAARSPLFLFVAVLSRSPVSTPHLQSSPNSPFPLACLNVSSPNPLTGDCDRLASRTVVSKSKPAVVTQTQTSQHLSAIPLIVKMASEEKGLTPAQPAISKSDGDVLPPSYDGHGSPTAPHHKNVADEIAQEPLMTRLGLTLDSFKPRAYGHGIVELDRSMKTRHLHMIAIGGSIGAGFFVGSGSALSTGGPGSLLIDFLIVGIMMFNVVYALGEMAVMYPVSGGFYTYSTRFIDPSWGFAMVSSLWPRPKSSENHILTDLRSGLELRLPMGHRPATRTHSLRSNHPILESRHLSSSLDHRLPRLHHHRQCLRNHRLRRGGVLV